jgi:hypothetical protein
VDGQQYRVRLLRGLARRAGPRLALGLSGELLELPLAAGVAEDHLVSGAREDRSQLAAHQARTQNAKAHGGLVSKPGEAQRSRGKRGDHVVAETRPDRAVSEY